MKRQRAGNQRPPQLLAFVRRPMNETALLSETADMFEGGRTIKNTPGIAVRVPLIYSLETRFGDLFFRHYRFLLRDCDFRC
jgi:hypothetical protein